MHKNANFANFSGHRFHEIDSPEFCTHVTSFTCDRTGTSECGNFRRKTTIATNCEKTNNLTMISSYLHACP